MNNNYKFYIVIYFFIILYIIIITKKNHKRQNQLHENFSSGFFNFKNKKIKYSECKNKCSVTYDDPDKIKACKSYCKCKKKCNSLGGKKKCLKDCKELKTNIYRDDEDKMLKIKLKKELKYNRRKEKKDHKILELKEQRKKIKELSKNDMNKKSYISELVNNYFGEKEKTYLVDLNQNTKNFVKDVKNIFRF